MDIETSPSGAVVGCPNFVEPAPERELRHFPGRRRTLLEIIERTAELWPGHLALEAPDARYTYAGLLKAADAIADRLRAQGVGRGDRVAVRLSSGRAELYVAILGVLTAGAAYVPIDADEPVDRANDILRRSGACVTISDDLQIEPTGQAPGGDRSEPTPDDDAWIIFTSGTTGVPKGVAVTHRAAAAFVEAEAQLWEVFPHDRVLAGLSVGFDASCEEIWLAWAHGAALLPAPRAIVRAGVELGSWSVEHNVSVVSTVPTLAALWDESCLHRVRLLILGGEACPEKLGWRLAAGREVWNTYGPTEATVVSTAARVVPGEEITIGWPLEGWHVAVLDGQRPVDAGEAGELVIGGVGVARYLDPELDSARFSAVPALGWERAYRTGDIVRMTPRGLQFLGRRDDQVKVGGRRIELGEVEVALQSAAGVRAAAVAVRQSSSGNKLLVGYVVGDGDCEQIRRHAASRLPAGVIPMVVAVPELPLGPSGKVDRRALPWPVGGDMAALAAGIGADGTVLTELEIWVGEHWTAELGPVAIAPHSDFFALGGTSVAAAKLISVLRRRYPAVAVADLYKHPTLRTFAHRLQQLATPAPSESSTLRVGRRRFAAAQLAGLLLLFAVTAVHGWLVRWHTATLCRTARRTCRGSGCWPLTCCWRARRPTRACRCWSHGYCCASSRRVATRVTAR